MKIFFTAIFIFGFLMINGKVKAAVIFEDNFDSQPDWQPKPATNDVFPSGGFASCDYNSVNCDVFPPPLNWNYYRTTGWWWGPEYQETIRITDQANHGTVGKSFIVNNEANNGSSGDGWGADGILTKYFNQEKPELYVSFWLKTQPNWIWNQNSRTMIKIFRIGHFDNLGTIFQGFPNGNLAPIYLYDLMYSPIYGLEQSHSFRCDPQLTDYYCINSPAGSEDSSTHFNLGGITKGEPINPRDPGLWADGNWHRHDFHIKMNTYNSESSIWNQDGILEFWYDGQLQKSKNNLKWINSGNDLNMGWNYVAIGGNAYNNYNETWVARDYAVGESIVYNSYIWTCIQAHTANSALYPTTSNSAYWIRNSLVTSQIEQWYAIDDVIVSTTAIPENYVIGSSQYQTSFSILNFMTLVSNWLKTGTAGDLNADNIANTRDLGVMMNRWN